MKRRLLSGFTLLLFTFCLCSIGALGQVDNKRKDFAQIFNQGGSVAWRVTTPVKSVTLRVSTPSGEVFSREFPAGSSPIFSLVSKRGSLYRDGSYSYEITVNPILSPGVEDALIAAREEGNETEVAADLKKRGLLPAALVQSGTFRVLAGQIFTKNDYVSEPEAAIKDGKAAKTKSEPANRAGDTDVPTDDAQTITQDLIVQGSTCTGFDCSSSESFGFDTFRLKENNLRIHFDDTSNSASFPNNDWRLTANDSTNGGANKFSIDDATAGRQVFVIEAAAPANSLFVSSEGRIGVKTSTPVVEIHNQ
jgi:hypothetical protein